jgi:transposase
LTSYGISGGRQFDRPAFMHKLEARDPYSEVLPQEGAVDKAVYIGIDIGKFQHSCSAPGSRSRDFLNTDAGLRDMLDFCSSSTAPESLFFVMESTGEYSRATAQALLEFAPVRVAIVPPTCVLGFRNSRIRRTKTDQVDALAIRQFGEVMQPVPWLPPTEAQQQLGMLKLVLDGQVKTITCQKCLLEKLESARHPSPLALAAQQRLLDHALAERKRLEAEIEALIQSDPALARASAMILSINGVGPATCATMPSSACRHASCWRTAG